MIEKEPSFGYRTVAWLLAFNRNTVQGIVQPKGWQVRTRPIGMRPYICHLSELLGWHLSRSGPQARCAMP